MTSPRKPSRRTALKAGLATAAAVAVPAPRASAVTPEELLPKAPGETRVVFLGGDNLHNFMAQEPSLRDTCERAGWKFYATHDARFVTPELIGTTDLLIIQRWLGPLPGWIPGPIYEKGAPGDGYMSDALENAIVENVRDRGMGFMSLHCTIWARARKKFTELLGVNPIIHGPIQPLHLHTFNQNHPITKGMTNFDLALDENFGAEIVNRNVVPLYESTGFVDKRHDYGGWCIEQGRGRVVGLLAGHTYFAYRDPNYIPLHWRGAHWAMRKEIPPYK